jgi:shikimate dehydrogenase
LIVNATSLGLHAGDPLPWDGATPFRPGQVVYDLIYHRPTELLALAQAGGATAINGLGMLIYQGALSAARWTGYGAGEIARWMQKELETL